MQAAKKAFTQIHKASGEDQCIYVFAIQETTPGKPEKTFTYCGAREKLDEPQDVSKGDSSFQVNFSTTVRAHRPDGAVKKPTAKPKAKSVAKASATKPKASVSSSDESEDSGDNLGEAPIEPEPVQVEKKTVPPRGGTRGRGRGRRLVRR